RMTAPGPDKSNESCRQGAHAQAAHPQAAHPQSLRVIFNPLPDQQPHSCVLGCSLVHNSEHAIGFAGWDEVMIPSHHQEESNRCAKQKCPEPHWRLDHFSVVDISRNTLRNPEFILQKIVGEFTEWTRYGRAP